MATTGCAPRYARVVKASAAQRGGEGVRWNMTVNLLNDQLGVVDTLEIREDGDGGPLFVISLQQGLRSPVVEALLALLKTADPDGFEVDASLWSELWEVADVIRKKKLGKRGDVRIGVTSGKYTGSGPVDGGKMYIATAGVVLPPEARTYLCSEPVQVDLARWVATKAGVL